MGESNTNQSVSINVEESGFYQGFNTSVAVIPKVVIIALILWVGLSPERAGEQLLSLQNWSISSFGGWYVYVTAFFTLSCLLLALWPRTGKVVLGQEGEKPEFSMFTGKHRKLGFFALLTQYNLASARP